MSAFGRIWTDLLVASSHRHLYPCGVAARESDEHHGPVQFVWVSDERSEVEVTTYVVWG